MKSGVICGVYNGNIDENILLWEKLEIGVMGDKVEELYRKCDGV